MLCDLKQRFLFEVIPDIIPGGRLTDVECNLWGMYYSDKNRDQR
jgi:hypothetical protein